MHVDEMATKLNCKLFTALKVSLEKRMAKHQQRDLYLLAAVLRFCTSHKVDRCNPTEAFTLKSTLIQKCKDQ